MSEQQQVSGLQEIAQHYAQQTGQQQPPPQQYQQQPPPQQYQQQPPPQQYQQPQGQPQPAASYDIPPNVAPQAAAQHAQAPMPFNPPEAQQAITGAAQQAPAEQQEKEGKGKGKGKRGRPRKADKAAESQDVQQTVKLDRSTPLETILTELWDRGYNYKLSHREL